MLSSLLCGLLEYTLPAQIISWLKISLPTIVPSPNDECVTKREMIVQSSSGEDAPAAMSVAPAMSSGMLKYSLMMLSAGTNLCVRRRHMMCARIGC